MRRGGGRRDQRRNRGKGQGRGTEDLDQGRTICLENTPAENPYLGPGTVAPSQGRGDRDPTRGRAAGGPGLIPGRGGRGRGKGEGPEKGEEGPGTDKKCHHEKNRLGWCLASLFSTFCHPRCRFWAMIENMISPDHVLYS